MRAVSTHLMRQSLFTSMLLAAVCCGVNEVEAQNFYRDYISDETQFYSPEDPETRGWIYRMQAGYAGMFNHCDDDINRRHSPYIYWQNRPAPECRGRIMPGIADISQQINEGVQRFTDGAGDCAVPHDCRGPKFMPTFFRGVFGCKDNCNCSACQSTRQHQAKADAWFSPAIPAASPSSLESSGELQRGAYQGEPSDADRALEVEPTGATTKQYEGTIRFIRPIKLQAPRLFPSTKNADATRGN